MGSPVIRDAMALIMTSLYCNLLSRWFVEPLPNSVGHLCGMLLLIHVITVILKEYLWPLLLTWFNFNLSMDK